MAALPGPGFLQVCSYLEAAESTELALLVHLGAQELVRRRAFPGRTLVLLSQHAARLGASIARSNDRAA
jgi:hypothetical protein